MSGDSRAHSRAPRATSFTPRRRRVAPLAAIALASVLVGSLAAAEPPPGVRILDAAAARGAGVAIRIERRPVSGGALIVVSPAGATGPDDRVLAVSAAGDLAAVADAVGPSAAGLTIARADGAQLQIRLPGVASAGFAPGGDWLAVLDGSGSLWRIDTATGASRPLSAGPFIGPPWVAADDSVSLLSVPSLEAPWTSSAVRIDPDSGVATLLSDEPLVYALLPMSGDRLALVAHWPGGLRIRQSGMDGRILAELGSGVTEASVSADGELIAFVRGDGGVFVTDGRQAARWLSRGDRPHVTPDGRGVLVRIGAETVLLGLDGSVLARVADGAAFLACAGECGS